MTRVISHSVSHFKGGAAAVDFANQQQINNSFKNLFYKEAKQDHHDKVY